MSPPAGWDIYAPVYGDEGAWWMETVHVDWSSNQRQVMKRSANAKRRRRDRQVIYDE